MVHVASWTTEDVGLWLGENGFSKYAELFTSEHRIDGLALLTLTEEDLKGPLMQMSILGDVKRLIISIQRLQYENRADLRSLPFRRVYSVPPQDEQAGQLTATPSLRRASSSPQPHTPLEPEYLKCLIAAAYMVSVFLATSMVMVVVHDRVPDMKKYPPLPDIVLDNLPYIPWAFEMAEFATGVLFSIWALILVFHKHRFILLRRQLSLAGSIFLLRCVTMLITSLSVPNKHFDCKPIYKDASWLDKFWRAYVIWRGMGMSTMGVRSCGDYMFSGHTCIVTILNFLITEYTPRRFYWLHTTSWCINMFAVFFILASHEHYSIDVFIAFYITSRLFLYYHSLASSGVLQHGDRKRTRIWFPLFSYFESTVSGSVPNEYESPIEFIRERVSQVRMPWWIGRRAADDKTT